MFCKKLVKWVVVPTALVAGTGFLFFGRGVTSYVHTAWNDASDAVRGSVPVEFELRRAKTLMQKIDPEIKEARREAIRAQIDLEQLDKQIRVLEATVAKTERKMQRHKTFLQGGETVTVFHGNREYGTVAVKAELARTFDAYRNLAELLNSKKSVRSRQSKIVTNTKTKLLAVKDERDRLQDAITALDARKRQIDALAATSSKTTEFDTSSLSEAKKLVAGITRRLDISERMIKEDLYLQTGEEATAVTADRDIVTEIDQYLSSRTPRTSAGTMNRTSDRLVKIGK